MNKKIFLALALAATGCWGSDPNMNSMIATGQGGTSGTGSAGSSGNATGPIIGMPYATFATATEGFQLNVYHDTGAKNLGDPTSGATPTLSFNSANGSPNNGSLKVMAPYSGSNQYVDIQKSMTTSPQN